MRAAAAALAAGTLVAGTLAAGTLAAGVAHAEPSPPGIGSGCPEDLAGAMTLLPDGQTYAVCDQGPAGTVWAAPPVPFEPNDTWLSYGPPIILHGQGMRNPNVTSGQWTATPRDPDTACRAEQQTVIEAGVLSDPEVSAGAPGEQLSVKFQPKLFYLTLSGDCVWVRSR